MNGASQETEVQVISGVPNDQVENKVAQLKASDRYVSHQVFPENGTSRIEVVVKKPV